MRRTAILGILIAVICCAIAPTAFAGAPKDRYTSSPKDRYTSYDTDGRYDVRVKANIKYGSGRVTKPAPGKKALALDLYRPVTKSKRRRPLVVLIHGGGFSGGARTSPDLVRIARRLASRGTIAVSISYRLIPDGPVPSKRVAAAAAGFADVPIFQAMVAAMDDTLTALDYLKRKAKRYRIDYKRIGIAGSSAGGITADHVAYVLDDLKIKAPKFRFAGSLWGGIFFKVDTNAAQLERGEAPLFAVHGDADSVVPVFLDDRLVARARAVGVPSEYYRVPGAGHGPTAVGFFTREVRPGQTAYDRFIRFAEKYLYAKKRPKSRLQELHALARQPYPELGQAALLGRGELLEEALAYAR